MPEPCLHIWHWDQAPAAYRALSAAGGDEDLVVWCPQELLDERWPHAIGNLIQSTSLVRAYVYGWGWLERHEVPGGVVVIVSHS